MKTPDHREGDVVSAVALPDAVDATLFGIFDVMNAFAPKGILHAGSSAFTAGTRADCPGSGVPALTTTRRRE
jgi:hypothetical protein